MRDQASNPRKRETDVAFFLPNLHGGGAQQVVRNLAEGFAKRGFAVDLLVTWAEGDLVRAVPDGVRLVEVAPPRVPVLGSLAGLPGMVGYLRTRSPAVLYSAMTYANLSAVAAARVVGERTVVVPTEHTMLERHQRTAKDRLVNTLAGRLYPAADAVVAVSESVATSVSTVTGVDRESVRVVHNPIVTDGLEGMSAASPPDGWVPGGASDVVLSAGRLAPEKGFDTLLRSVERLVTDHRRDAALVLLGEGPERGSLERLAEELGIEDRVSMPGYVDNPYCYMRRASVFASASRFEGLPTVLVEAMACGCPVVATDCPGGTAEVLGDGRYGSLVPVGDPGALATAVDTVVSSPPDRSTLRKRAADFSMEPVLDDHLRLLRSLGAFDGSEPHERT